HQAGAEGALLYPLARAAAVQIDLVVAVVRADAGGGREFGRLAAAELQRHRMLGGVEAEYALPVAKQDRLGREHLGIEARTTAQQAMEVPAVPVGEVDHGGDAERMGRDGDHRRILVEPETSFREG